MAKHYSLGIFLLFAVQSLFAQWTALNGPLGGNAVDIEVDAANSKIYTIINNERLFVSSNDGTSWSELAAAGNLYPYDFMVSGGVLYFISYNTLYKSEDAGVTWQRVNTNSYFQGGIKLLRQGTSNTFFVTGYYGMFVSEDSGETWNKLHNNYITSAVLSASGDLYFSTSEGIFKHVVPGSGQQWSSDNITNVYSLSSNTIRLISDANGVYATTDSDVLKTSDNGVSWPSVKTSTIVETYFSSCIWAKAPNGIYLINSGSQTVYFSGNGGSSWSAKTYPATSSAVMDMKFVNNNTAFVGTNMDAVFKTTDAAATWSLAAGGLIFPTLTSIVVASSRILASTGSYTKRYWFSDTGGASWSQKVLSNPFEKLCKLPNNTILALGYSALQYSTDNGSNWTAKSDGTSFLDVTFNTTFSSTTIYGVGSNAIAKSTDGINWTALTITGLPTGYQATAAAQDDAGNLFLYLYNYSLQEYELYLITGLTAAGTTGAASLLSIPLGQLDAQYGTYLTDVFVSNNKLYVGTYYSIYITNDQGTTWTTVDFSKNSLFPLKKGTEFAICAGTSGSLYISQDDGKTWTSTNMPGNGYRYINGIAEDAAGDYYAATAQAPVMKFTNELILPTASLPPYIDFNWQPTNGPYGGTIERLLTDNSSNSYALASGRIFKIIPAFTQWEQKPFANYAYDIEIDKANNKLYALSYNQLHASTDGGSSWSLLNNENIVQRQSLRRCPNGDLVFSGNGNEVYVSTNGGTTFGTPRYTTSTHYIRNITVTSTNAIIVLMNQNVSPYSAAAIISTDRGVTWNPMNLNSSTSSFPQLSADASGNIYSTANPLSKSSDNGANWTSIVNNLPSTNITSKVYTSPANALYLVLRSNVISLYKSTTGGSNWSKTGDLPGRPDVNDITWIGTRMVLATRHGIYVSDDDGATFTGKNAGIPFDSHMDLESTGPSKLLVTAEELAFATTNGQDWEGRDINDIRSFFRKPDGTLLGHSYFVLYSSADQGATWASISQLPSYADRIVTSNGTTFYASSGNNIWVTNDLLNWSEFIPTGMPSTYYIYDLDVDLNGFVYVQLYNYELSTVECYQIVFGSASKLNRFDNVANLLFDDEKIYVYESEGLISSSSDGSNWNTQSSPSGNQLIIASNNYYFIPQYNGSLWLSRDRGASWQNVGLSGLGNSLFTNIVVDEYTGYAYGAVTNSVIRKSANIVIPAETVNPVVNNLQPANNATDVVATTTLKITFDEACLPVSGKKVRIFDTDNTITPVEIIDATAGTQDGKTFIFTPSTPLAYENSYFIIVDNGAFADIFENPFGGITSATAWRFTIQVEPDNIKPVITPSSPAFVSGGNNKLQISVADDGGSGLNAASVKVHYRGIMATGTPAEAVMTNSSGNTFEITVPDAWMDELGLEYVFEARDNQGNIQLSPADALTNGNYHHAYISFPENATPTLPSSVLSFGGQLQNYRIFSVPHKLGNANISTIFSEVTTLEVKKDFRILSFTTETDSYSEYPTLSSIARGRGYWINFKNSFDATIEGASTPENSKEQLFSYTLRPGWNQIGNPYPFTISWNAVKTAAGNNAIGVMKTFNGSTFVDDDKLNPFEGGFVLLNGSANVTVEFPFSAKTTSGRLADHSLTFEGGWMVELKAANSQFHSLGGVGMHPEANASFDRYDDAMPPKIFEMPEISFHHEEHFIKRFTRDVVPPQNEYVWNFTVTGVEENATLEWDVNTVKKLGSDLYLLDERNQNVINMAEQGQCVIDPQRSATFRIYYGYRREDIKPTKIVLSKPYPNPFTTQSNVAFTLPENQTGAYVVSLDVYDLLGKKITNIARGEYPSGFYLGEWTPEATSITGSLYFYRLTVVNGKERTVLTQKIITKK